MRTPRVAWIIPLAFSVSLAEAVDLQDRTISAFDRYAQEAAQKFVRRATGPDAPQDPVISVQPGAEDGIITVPGGLVHHWKGAVFIRGAKLQDALSLSCSYDDYRSIYTSVVDSSLLEKDG